MEIPQIQIRQQFAKIKLDTKDSFLEIRQKKAEQSIEQPRGKLEIRKKDVRVEIDNYPFRHDLGIKNNVDFRCDNVRRAKEVCLAAIARYASQGDRLMRIENKGNVLMDIIEEDFTPETKEIGLKWVRGPEFHVRPPELEIKYTAQKPRIEVRINPPHCRFHQGKVKIEMAQYNKIEFFLKGNLLDRMV